MLEVKYDDKGLVATVVQDNNTNEVLMVAYMNEESLRKTLETKTTWFFSRSRQELWNKGATSGNYQKVIDVLYDCDGDALLVKVEPVGPSCHTGENSCFYRKISGERVSENLPILEKLYGVIEGRKENPKEGSYTNYLFDKGVDKILKKVGEENSEVIIAAKNNDNDELVYEISDLAYHILVLMVEKGVSLLDIKKELEKRYK